MKTVDLLFKTLWIPDKNKLSELKDSINLQIDYDNLSTLNHSESKTLNNTLDTIKVIATNQPAKLINHESVEAVKDHVVQINKMVVQHTQKSSSKLTWEELEYQAKNCHDCDLCHDRKNVVIERGSRNAKWMFIGEAPGEQEDIQGKPFVGASGQLLDKMIRAMKLNPETDVYIANIIKCRPPQNRNPVTQEIELCKNYILNQIELIQPKVIILLGRFAIQTILSTTNAVGKLRGTIHKFNNEIPTIATYHPSYLLRTPDAKREAWNDLQLAMKTFSDLS
ncbi:MAG: uracil-DNA glycosylase [Burkholderiales bacterium]|nr:uracil-DNA glycosylase [Burkholderiales bacterium]